MATYTKISTQDDKIERSGKKMFYTCEKMIYLKKSKLKYMALIIKPIYTYQRLYKNNTTKYL